jgi:hypothetical protein
MGLPQVEVDAVAGAVMVWRCQPSKPKMRLASAITCEARCSAPGLDQLKHLRAKGAGPTLAVKCLEDQLGRSSHVAPLRRPTGLIIEAAGLLQQRLAHLGGKGS